MSVPLKTAVLLAALALPAAASAVPVLPDFAAATFVPGAAIDNRYFPLLDRHVRVYVDEEEGEDERFETQVVGRGLEIARQLAILTYRAEPGLDARQPRPAPGSDAGYPVQSYLEHQGRKLRNRFAAQAYELQLAAMDHHDLTQPLPGDTQPAISRVRAATLVVDVDTDQLFTPAQAAALTAQLVKAGAPVSRETVASIHGHDAFLIEWKTLGPLLTKALHLQAPSK